MDFIRVFESDISPSYFPDTVFSDFASNPKRLAFSYCGKFLASAHDDDSIEIRNIDAQIISKKFRKDSINGLTDLVWRPRNHQIITSSMDHKVRLLDVEAGLPVLTFFEENCGPHSCAASPDGNIIVSGSLDKNIRMWDARTGLMIKSHFGHGNGVTAVNFSPNGDRIVSTGLDGFCSIWQLHGQKPSITFPVEKGNLDIFGAMFVNRDSVVTSQKNVLQMWHSENGHSIGRFAGHRNDFYHMHADFSLAEGRWLFMGSENKQIFVWDIEKKEIAQIFKGHSNVVLCTAANPLRSIIATSSIDTDRCIKIWKRKENIGRSLCPVRPSSSFRQ